MDLPINQINVPTYWKIVKTLFFSTLAILIFTFSIELSDYASHQNTNPHPYRPTAIPKTNGVWTDWNDWSGCDQITCDTNCTKVRTRRCMGYLGGIWCIGPASQMDITPNPKCWTMAIQLADIQEKIMQLQMSINSLTR